MATRRFSLSILLLIAASNAPAADADRREQYVGSGRCGECHRQAFRDWDSSHHRQAMQTADEYTVLGDFSGSEFSHFGVTSSFYRKDGAFFVRTDNADGDLQEFPVAYTFGAYPLQQYLIPFDDGRLQALSIAWDSRPAAEGGQRWFHLYPDEAVPHDDPLHWTGAFQNWNSRCASCHSTDLKKNYRQQSDSYRTDWAEINVACEACHGPGREHIAWAGGAASIENRGLAVDLASSDQWQDADGPTRRKQGGSRMQRQLDVCAPCHSRRRELGGNEAGRPFLDQYTPSLLRDGLYFADGQIDDEVYVYGSFLQSRMHAEGVVCSDCHQVHSLALKAEGNALCGQCHAPGHFDVQAHHRHAEGSAGALCVNCHMPERDYMVVDPRRDHSFRVPQPLLSDLLGTPNACNGCHRDRDNSWAQQSLKNWHGRQPLRDRHANTFAIARGNRAAALQPLIELSGDDSAAAIVRATALMESGRFLSPTALANAVDQLTAADGLVRLGAVRALDGLPPADSYTVLKPLLDDPLKSVRMAVAANLSRVDIGALPADQRQRLAALFSEYLASLHASADMPSAQLNIGMFHTGRGDVQAAHAAYAHALKLAPAYTPAMLNKADLYRAAGDDDNAKRLLARAIEVAPEEAPANHAMGLLLVRQQNIAGALVYLQRAADSAPDVARYSYVYGVALHSSGYRKKAIETLTEAAWQHPDDVNIRKALEAYRRGG